MAQIKRLRGRDRKHLIEELYLRYSHPRSSSQKIRYLRKKYLWLLFVQGAHFLKRVLDVIIAAFLLLILFPFMGIIAAIITLHDGGPVFYTQQRVGKWGKEFLFRKFRSMALDAEIKKVELKTKNIHQDDLKFKMIDDPRVTPFGKFLRQSSLDELPQLWNVIKGEMSLVGPRPPLPEEVAEYSLEERKRLDVKPGLTCFWQVNGRSEIPFNRQVELDIAYIESQSFWLDLQLLLKTIPAVLFGRGAY